MSDVGKAASDAAAKVNELADNKDVQAVANVVSSKLPPQVRKWFYVIGIVLGALGTAGAVIATVLTDNSQVLVGGIAALLLAVNSALAKAHLSA